MTPARSPIGPTGGAERPRERAELSDRELHLVRSALGLRGKSGGQSYRNRFVLFDQSDDHDLWEGLARRGLAVMDRQFWPKPSIFCLTRDGAEAALQAGESLCPEDFPPTPIATTEAGR